MARIRISLINHCRARRDLLPAGLGVDDGREVSIGIVFIAWSIIMAGFLVAVSLLLRKFDGFSLQSFSSRDWLFIILAGIAGALSWLFYFFALKAGLASKVVVIDRLSLIFVIVLAALFLGETLGWKSALGGLLMVGGAILISLQ